MKVLLDDASLYSAAETVRMLSGKSDLYAPSEIAGEIQALDCIVVRERDSNGRPLIVDASRQKTTSIPAYQFGSTGAAANPYGRMTSVTLSDKVQVIDNNAFFSASALESITLPPSLLIIGVHAFCGCLALTEVTIPSKVRTVLSNAFQNCTGLCRVTFSPRNGTLPTVYSNAFAGCTQLREIRVPWSEGAVEGAPWGATNATVVYNAG